MYIIIKALSITKWVELISKKKFVTATLNLKDEAFLIYVVFVNRDLNVYTSCRAHMVLLMVDKTSGSILFKYTNLIDVFSKDLAVELSEYIGINDFTIKLIERHQLSYKSSYILRPIELKALKTYIKTYLANNFLKLSKFSISAPILLIKKPNYSL